MPFAQDFGSNRPVATKRPSRSSVIIMAEQRVERSSFGRPRPYNYSVFNRPRLACRLDVSL
jgi:hypothetical protein